MGGDHYHSQPWLEPPIHCFFQYFLTYSSIEIGYIPSTVLYLDYFSFVPNQWLTLYQPVISNKIELYYLELRRLIVRVHEPGGSDPGTRTIILVICYLTEKFTAVFAGWTQRLDLNSGTFPPSSEISRMKNRRRIYALVI